MNRAADLRKWGRGGFFAGWLLFAVLSGLWRALDVSDWIAIPAIPAVVLGAFRTIDWLAARHQANESTTAPR